MDQTDSRCLLAIESRREATASPISLGALARLTFRPGKNHVHVNDVQLELDGSLQRILLQNTQGEQVPKIAAVITWRSFPLSRSTRQSRDSLLRSRAESGINLL